MCKLPSFLVLTALFCDNAPISEMLLHMEFLLSNKYSFGSSDLGSSNSQNDVLNRLKGSDPKLAPPGTEFVLEEEITFH